MILIGILVIAGAIYYLYKTKTGEIIKDTKAQNIGVAGENEIAQLLMNTGIRSYIFKNVYVQFNNGKSTEIDLVMLTASGIYVIESKNYSGAIFGNENEHDWEVIYNSGKRYKLYNPIMQNITHIRALSSALRIPQEYFISVVVFGNKANISGINASSTVLNTIELQRFIQQDVRLRGVCFTPQNIRDISNSLSLMTNVSNRVKKSHIKQVRNDYK